MPYLIYLAAYGPLVAVMIAVFTLTPRKWKWYARAVLAVIAAVLAMPVVSVCLLYYFGDS